VPLVRCEGRADLGFGASGGEFIEVDGGGESAVDAARVTGKDFYSILSQKLEELAEANSEARASEGLIAFARSESFCQYSRNGVSQANRNRASKSYQTPIT